MKGSRNSESLRQTVVTESRQISRCCVIQQPGRTPTGVVDEGVVGNQCFYPVECTDMSIRLSTNTIFEFQTSDVSRALARHVGFSKEAAHGMRWMCDVIK